MKTFKHTSSSIALVALLAAAPVAGFAQSNNTASEAPTAEAPMTDESANAATEKPVEGEANETTAAQAGEEIEEDIQNAENALEETAQDAENMAEDAAQAVENTAEDAAQSADNMLEGADDPITGPETDTDSAEVAAKPVDGHIAMQGANTVLADNLIGSNVYSSNGDSIGEIDNLIVSLDGKIDGVVIGVGGFLGIGEKDVAVQMASLTASKDDWGNVRLTSNATKEDLEAAEEFQSVAAQPAAPESIESAPATGTNMGSDG